MALLTITKDFTANGRTYQVGEHIRVSDGQVLIARGYARVLTKAEAGAILDEYVKMAKSVFPQIAPRKEILRRTPKRTVDQGGLF